MTASRLRAMNPEIVELESEDGRAFGLMSDDGENLLALFPMESAQDEPQAFAAAVLLLAAPRMLAVIESLAQGGPAAQIQAECREIVANVGEALRMDGWTSVGPQPADDE